MKLRHVDTGITQRGNNYTFTVAMGMDVNGKQIRKTTTYIPPEGLTEKKADKLAKEAYIDFKRQCKGCVALNENMRFKELSDLYFDVYAPNKLKETTIYHYKGIVKRHFTDYFGNKKLKDITPGMLSDFFCKLTVKDVDGNDIPMTPGGVKGIYIVMKSIMSYAVSQGFIKETPCRRVILPQEDREEDKKRKYLTEEEIPDFLAIFDGYSVINTIVKLLLYTGMRSGEAVGLQWKDIDFKRGTISIEHTLSYTTGKYYLSSPKTKTSRRVIYMSTTVIELLKEHRRHQLELQTSLAPNFPHPEMVFTNGEGDYKSTVTVNNSLKRKLRGTPFKFITPHSLRHTNASLLLNGGVDLKIVSEHLGHANISTTGNIYADVYDSTRKETAEILELKLAQ